MKRQKRQFKAFFIKGHLGQAEEDVKPLRVYVSPNGCKCLFIASKKSKYSLFYGV